MGSDDAYRRQPVVAKHELLHKLDVVTLTGAAEAAALAPEQHPRVSRREDMEISGFCSSTEPKFCSSARRSSATPSACRTDGKSGGAKMSSVTS